MRNHRKIYDKIYKWIDENYQLQILKNWDNRYITKLIDKNEKIIKQEGTYTNSTIQLAFDLFYPGIKHTLMDQISHIYGISRFGGPVNKWYRNQKIEYFKLNPSSLSLK